MKENYSLSSKTRSSILSLNKRKVQDISKADLDYKSKRLARINSLVPKLRRLAESEIEKYSNNSQYSSSSSGITRLSAKSSKQLKIKFSNMKQNSSSRQYSIVTSDEQPVDVSQPLRKVLRNDSGERAKPAPVLKISFGKESQVLTVSARSDDSENVKPSRSGKKSLMTADAARSKAARKALKRAKREAARRSSGAGTKSPVSVGFSHNVLSSRTSSVSSPSSPAYTLMCPSSQKIIFKKIRAEREKLETPTSIREDLTEEEGGASTDILTESGNLCVGDTVWGRSDCHQWWPAKVESCYKSDS